MLRPVAAFIGVSLAWAGSVAAQDLPTMLRTGAIYNANGLTICQTHQDAVGLLATFKDAIENRVVRRSGQPIRCETNVSARFTPLHTDLSLKGEQRRLVPSLFGAQPCTPEVPEKRCDLRTLEVTFIKVRLLASESETTEAYLLDHDGIRVIDDAGRIVTGR